MESPELPVVASSTITSSLKQDPVVGVGEVLDPETTQLIVQSPYTEIEHLLDPTTLDHENALLAQALTKMQHLRPDYSTAPYTETFNWPVVVEELKRLAARSGKGFRKTSFYIVAFRSQIKPNTDCSLLGSLDKAAHAEAVASGGFLKYWFGSPNDDRRNLATCVWRSREDAVKGGRGPAHKKAAGSTRALYSFWKIDQHRLVIKEGAESWSIVPWTTENRI